MQYLRLIFKIKFPSNVEILKAEEYSILYPNDLKEKMRMMKPQ